MQANKGSGTTELCAAIHRADEEGNTLVAAILAEALSAANCDDPRSEMPRS